MLYPMSLSTYLCSLAPFLPKDESLGSILVWPKSCNFKGLGYVHPKYTENDAYFIFPSLPGLYKSKSSRYWN